MIRAQIQFKESMYETLKKQSKQSGKSVSDIVRRSLDETLEKQAVEQKWARAFQSAGKFQSGLKDLAEKHDAHLGDRW
jgi:hypothetical protein